MESQPCSSSINLGEATQGQVNDGHSPRRYPTLIAAISEMVPVGPSINAAVIDPDIDDGSQTNQDRVNDISVRLTMMTAQPGPDPFAGDDIAVLTTPAPAANLTVATVTPVATPDPDVSVARLNLEPDVVAVSPAPSEIASGNNRNNPRNRPEPAPRDEPEPMPQVTPTATSGGLLSYETGFDGTTKGNFDRIRVNTNTVRSESSIQVK